MFSNSILDGRGIFQPQRKSFTLGGLAFVSLVEYALLPEGWGAMLCLGSCPFSLVSMGSCAQDLAHHPDGVLLYFLSAGRVMLWITPCFNPSVSFVMSFSLAIRFPLAPWVFH